MLLITEVNDNVNLITEGTDGSKEYHIERYFRDAPLMCIGEGTNEIQRMIIAKQLIERNGQYGLVLPRIYHSTNNKDRHPLYQKCNLKFYLPKFL